MLFIVTCLDSISNRFGTVEMNIYMIRMKINVRQMENKPRRTNLRIHILEIPRRINRAHRNKAIYRTIIERKMFSNAI